MPIILLLALFGNAQEKTSTWTKFKEVDGVTVDYQYVECTNMNYGFDTKSILLKITNTTKEAKKVDWDLDLWYNNELVTGENKDEEYHHTAVLRPETVIEGTCDDFYSTYKIFVKFTDPQYKGTNPKELTDFSLTNIQVESFHNTEK